MNAQNSCRNNARYSSRLKATVSLCFLISLSTVFLLTVTAQPLIELANHFAIGMIK
jgi:hypothetical protein